MAVFFGNERAPVYVIVTAGTRFCRTLIASQSVDILRAQFVSCTGTGRLCFLVAGRTCNILTFCPTAAYIAAAQFFARRTRRVIPRIFTRFFNTLVVCALLSVGAIGIACTAARFFDALVIARFIASTAGNRNARIVFAFLTVAAITIGSAAAGFFAASVVFGFVAGAAGNRGANVVFAFLVAVAVGVAGAAVRLGNALVVARLLTSGARQRLASVA